MKILDKYLLKNFVFTFISVFVILFFIFILQTVWLFISELAGKDLDFLLIVKFLVFKMPSIIPMVLPLSVLLSSIMTFGSLAENYEFAAMKSSGISLQRSMKPLTIFIVIMSFITFAFANNVIPYAEYKFINFRRNIAQVKPAMAIVEGQFCKIGDYTIKVDKKSGDNGNLLSGIIIHLKSASRDVNKTIIKAKKGELISNKSSNTLKLVLYDGYYYEDIQPKKYEERERMPFAKATFKKDVINIDLTKLNTDQETGEIANTNTMLNVKELNYTLDSLSVNLKKTTQSYCENAFSRLNPNITSGERKVGILYNDLDLLKKFNKDQKIQVLKNAYSTIESTSFALEYYKLDMVLKQKNINEHLIVLYEKFVISFSCILMFFIGAPLGAIIRKGGLGLPIVFAVTIFIIFHFINTFGKKVAQEDGINPFLGTWMSTIILAPLAIFLTYRAINDVGGMINFGDALIPFQKMFSLFENKKQVLQPKAIINLESCEIIEDEEYYDLQIKNSEVLVRIIKNSNQFNYSNNYRIKALKILNDRGITQEQLQAENNLDNIEYISFYDNVTSYYSSIKLTLFFYVLSIIASLILNNNPSFWFLLLYIICLFLFYFSSYFSQKKVENISQAVGRKLELGTSLAVLLGFPFFILIYFYNKKLIKEAITEFNN